MQNLETSIRKTAKNLLNNSKGSHDWEHSLRVYRLANHIAQVEEADLRIVRIAALLHDIGRHHEDRSKGQICHAQKGAQMARAILEQEQIDADVIKKICDCIATHRFRDNKTPQTLEAKVLFDADKLDSIGAVGIGRAFLFAGEVGAKLHNPNVDIAQTQAYTEEDTAYREFMVKLRHVQDRMLTVEGRRLAAERHKFMVRFFERLDHEVEGEI